MGITQDYDVIKCENLRKRMSGDSSRTSSPHVYFQKISVTDTFFSDDKAGASLIVISMMPITF